MTQLSIINFDFEKLYSTITILQACKNHTLLNFFFSVKEHLFSCANNFYNTLAPTVTVLCQR